MRHTSFSMTIALAMMWPGLLAQKLSLGVIGGGSLTDAFPTKTVLDPPREPIPGFPEFPLGTRYFSQAKDFVGGGMLEVRFTPHWSVEVDALFRQLHVTWAAVLRDGSLNSVSPSPVVTWQFPVLAKYRFQGRRVNPFIEAGPSFRTAGNLNGTNPSHHGVTAGLGVEMYWRSFKIAPAVRYTRWAKDNWTNPRPAPNQVELLVGFSREAETNWRPFGRRMSMGVTMGTNLTGDFTTVRHDSVPTLGPLWPISSVTSSGPRRLIVGPTVEFGLPCRLSVEVDALYRPLSSGSESIYADGSRQKGAYSYVTWEFPVMAKYRIPLRRIQPFIALGPSFRRPQTLSTSSPFGVVAGAGVEFRARYVKIAPAVRFTHWGRNSSAYSDDHRNQSEFLVGFTF